MNCLSMMSANTVLATRAHHTGCLTGTRGRPGVGIAPSTKRNKVWAVRGLDRLAGGGRAGSRAGWAALQVEGGRTVLVLGHILKGWVDDIVRLGALDTTRDDTVGTLVAHLLVLGQVGLHVLVAKDTGASNVAGGGRGSTSTAVPHRIPRRVGHTGRHVTTLGPGAAGRRHLTDAPNPRPALTDLGTMRDLGLGQVARGDWVTHLEGSIGRLAVLNARVMLLNLALGHLFAQALDAFGPRDLKPHLFLGKEAVAQGARAPDICVVTLGKIAHQTTGFQTTHVGRVVGQIRGGGDTLASNHVHRHVGGDLKVGMGGLALGHALSLGR